MIVALRRDRSAGASSTPADGAVGTGLAASAPDQGHRHGAVISGRNSCQECADTIAHGGNRGTSTLSASAVGFITAGATPEQGHCRQVTGKTAIADRECENAAAAIKARRAGGSPCRWRPGVMSRTDHATRFFVRRARRPRYCRSVDQASARIAGRPRPGLLAALRRKFAGSQQFKRSERRIVILRRLAPTTSQRQQSSLR